MAAARALSVCAYSFLIGAIQLPAGAIPLPRAQKTFSALANPLTLRMS
jgi:hypothetical protein